MPITRKPLDSAIAEYLAYRTSHSDAANTVRNNGQVLGKALSAWGNVFVQDIGPQHIARLFGTTNWSASTRNQYRSNLASFFKWARACNYMSKDHDPLAGWGTVRVPEVEQFRVPVEDFPALLDAAPHPRDRIITALGIYTLCRGSELAALRVCDVDMQALTLHVYRIKTKQEDWLPICEELRDELVRWFNYYRADQGTLEQHWYLAPAKDKAKHRPAGQAKLVRVPEDEHLRPEVKEAKPYRAVQRAMKAIGIDPRGKRIGVHTTRRSGARALADQYRTQGVDATLLEVGSMMGHKDTKTTQSYIGWNMTRIQRNERLAGKRMFDPGSETVTDATNVRSLTRGTNGRNGTDHG